jgi:23S rRNA (guanosine2251-2'-O)-methyltransferase
MIGKFSLPIRYVQRSKLDRFGPHHQGLVLLIKPAKIISLDEFLAALPSGPALILVLDHVNDPHNLGALVRSAAAFGAKALIAPIDRSAPTSQAARSASAGACEVVPVIRVVNLPRAIDELKKADFWVVGAEAEKGEVLGDFSFPPRCALILGGEDHGLGREVAKRLDYMVNIPLIQSEIVNSLNVSNAGAIVMYAYHNHINKR